MLRQKVPSGQRAPHNSSTAASEEEQPNVSSNCWAALDARWPAPVSVHVPCCCAAPGRLAPGPRKLLTASDCMPSQRAFPAGVTKAAEAAAWHGPTLHESITRSEANLMRGTAASPRAATSTPEVCYRICGTEPLSSKMSAGS